MTHLRWRFRVEALPMGGFFYNLGRMVGPKLRKANWVFRSLTGTEADSIRAEHAVGRDLALAFLAETEADDHPAVAEVLGQIGGRLVDGVKDRQWPFHFLAVRSTQLNAFALPGGFIFVTRPLLEFCHWDRDELAFVLGHEMGHVLHRHAIDRVMASSLLSTAVGRLLPARGLLRLPLGSAITTLLQQSYSRDQELEADRTGVQLARVAGYDAAAASRLLARLQANIGTVVGWDAYFLSHPPADVRIEAITRLLRSRPSPDQ